VRKTKDEYISEELERLMHRKYMHQFKVLLLVDKDLGEIYGI
jgi:hypothetical protein